MTSDWRLVAVGDLGRIITGRTPTTSRPELFGSAFPFITPTDIDDRRYCTPARGISTLGARTQQGALLPPGAVCVTCIGSIGKMCVTHVQSFTNQQINAIVVDEHSYEPLFVYYALRRLVTHLPSIAGGAATPIINKTTFAGLRLTVPVLDKQRQIAQILSGYDDLIENCHRRIRILEEMARALYREWFILFRYPGHARVPLVRSVNGPMPKGWELKPLSALIRSHIGGGWGAETPDDVHSEPAFVLRGTDLPRIRAGAISGVPFRYHKSSNLRSRRLVEGDIIFEASGGSKSQLVGRTMLVTAGLRSAFCDADLMCASFCKRIVPDQAVYGSELLFLSFQEAYDNGEIERFQVQSTGISNFRWNEYIAQTPRLVPPRGLRESFRRLVVPLFALISLLGVRSENLRKTRDLLLPRLLSGKIRLEDVG